MKTLTIVELLAFISVVSIAQAGPGTLQFPREPQPEPKHEVPRVWVDTNYQPPEWSKPQQATTGSTYVYEQKLYGGNAMLISPEQAQKIVDNFKTAYPKLGSPRILIYVNRDLVDENSGMKPTHGKQHIEGTKSFGAGSNDWSSIKTTTDQNFRTEEKSQPTLADKQTVRDVERLFGRPLRQAGASLVDQRVAAQLIADRPISEFIGTSDSPQARKDREAISKIADAVIEVLISSKSVTATTISGQQTISVPDIQATAIRLSDSKILAQATSADVTDRVSASALASFSTPEITEATALALMDEIASEAK